MTSPFLSISKETWVASNALAFAIHDRYPVSLGHTLVIPRRLIATWFEATVEEQAALFDLVANVKAQLDAAVPKPDGYNIGINVGDAAGQTVHHLHVHVIPRYRGDVDDPRGGVRHVIPGKGNYLANQPAPLATGGADDPFARHLTPLWALATDVAILAAFVQESGLAILKAPLFDALNRGARVRVVTGDYLGITQAAALEQLLDWTSYSDGRFEARVVETAKLPGGSTSFHPKSWRFEGPNFGTAFVGSSNVSRSALGAGIEWNLRLDRQRDPDAWRRLIEAFDAWWLRARKLDAAWVADYARRVMAAPYALPPGEEDASPVESAPPPHDLQRDALAALAKSRDDGRKRACVVLATGLGKTLLAAFDVRAWATDKGRLPRVLLLAHREELLEQAGRTFRRVLREQWPGVMLGWFVGERSDMDGDVVLASVQKLVRDEHLARLSPGTFDYVIVDEVHHAAAPSYRRILDRLQPEFLLGLTATPERADGGDVLGLFDDNVAYRADLGVGITRKLLVPFAYFGLKDDIDYANIPWRNQRFEPEALAKAAETERRMATLWEAWQQHPGTRTLVFCCSVRHADFARDWLRAKGVRAESTHSGPTSADRETVLKAFEEGSIDAVCAVDLFNEGLDVPKIDRVVMLRPTESSIVFLQQLGRGLRVSPEKERLTIIDFVGNHRVFLERIRTLLTLSNGRGGVREWIASGVAELPPGCSVDVAVEAKTFLEKLLPSGRSEVERVYRELLAVRGTRPTAGELFRMGYKPSTVRESYGGWFEFAEAAGGLSEQESAVLAQARPWFRELEITPMVKSFKMVVLQVLLEAERLTSSIEVHELAQRSHDILVRSPELFKDLEGVRELRNARQPEPGPWLTYWKDNPITAWTSAKRGAKSWFQFEGSHFISRLPTVMDATMLASMTRELVDYRLAQYRARRTSDESTATGFEARVTWNQRDPILKLPRLEGRPEVDLDVRLPDGSMWTFGFRKEFCNVARPVASQRNALPDLLRRWFGPSAGRPGTGFSVRFSRSPDGWWVEPIGGQVIQFPARGKFISFPSLRAAAGAINEAQAGTPEADEVRLPAKATGERLFVVRAAGDSMDGGSEPIHDGDWLVMRWARSEGIATVEGRIALVQTADDGDAYGYQIKRVVREKGHWILRSENPGRPSFDASPSTVPIALLAEVIRPEALAPPPGTVLSDEQLADAFGLEAAPREGRVDGHLFLFVEGTGAFVAPDRLNRPVPDRRPGETAFLLTRSTPQAPWTYLGVGRWIESEGLWQTPDLDFATWRSLGSNPRSASRRLSDDAQQRAEKVAEQLLAITGAGRPIEQDGKLFRVVGPAKAGGIRVDGGPDGFAERTVSLTDLAWVIIAEERAGTGGVLDEALVNRVRYLDGTPKESTRWIDTGWAIRLVTWLRQQKRVSG